MIIFMNNENGNVLNYKGMLDEWKELYDGGDDTNPVACNEHYTALHQCKCCGEFEKGMDEDVLCEECRMTFGHAFFSEL